MSRQRPYGSMMEAYVLMLTIDDRLMFECFLDDCRGFAKLGKEGTAERMRLPALYWSATNKYVIFWQCLCRMYGEMFTNSSESYIYTNNLDIMIHDLEYCYGQVKDDCVQTHDPDFKY